MTKQELGEIKKLLHQLVKSKRSSFYRKRFHSLNVSLKDISSQEDFENLPFLEKKEIVRVDPFDRLYVSPDEIYSYNLSSGTTAQGNPLLVPLAKWDEITLRECYRQLERLKVKRVLLMANVAYSGAHATDYLLDKRLKKFPYILGDMTNLQLSAWIGAKLRIDGIETFSSTLFYLIPYLKEAYDLDKIKFIAVGGEYISNQRYAYFKQFFKNAYFDFRYGGSECQVSKGFRCDFLGLKEPRFFHPVQEHYYYEVVDQFTGKLVKNNEEGELVETSLQISPFPLVRYRSGDLIKLDRQYQCLCGRKGVMEILGRARNDSLKLYGVSIHVEMIEKALAGIAGISPLEYELHIYEKIHKNKLRPALVLHILAVGKTSPVKELAKTIEKKFVVSSTLRLSDLVQQEIFLPLQVELKKQWPRKYKSLKIIPHFD